jgi:hypothetical protein
MAHLGLIVKDLRRPPSMTPVPASRKLASFTVP